MPIVATGWPKSGQVGYRSVNHAENGQKVQPSRVAAGAEKPVFRAKFPRLSRDFGRAA